MRDCDVAVVGGGLAGISAALALKAQGRDVLILEASETLGGKLGTVVSPHGTFSTGPSSFSGRAMVMWRLLDALALRAQVERLAPATATRYLVRDGALRAIRPGPLGLLGTRAISFIEKWALFRDYARKGSARPDAQESLRAYCAAHFGISFTENVLAAVFNGVFAGDLSRLSAATCLPQSEPMVAQGHSAVRGMLEVLRRQRRVGQAGTFGFRHGIHCVGEAAGRAVDAWTQARVERVEPSASGSVLSVRVARYERFVRAQHVVVATEAPAAAELVAQVWPDVATHLRTFAYAPLALVHWIEDAPDSARLPTGFGYLAPRSENTFALGTLFVGDFFVGGRRRFTSFVGGALTPKRAFLSDGDLQSRLAEDIRRLRNGSLGTVAAVTRWEHAVYQPNVGHAERVEALRRGSAGLPISFAGSYLGSASMRDAITSGEAAARAAVARAHRMAA